MYFRAPSEIAGSFFIRHHGFRIRIDDVEHFISGYCLYRRFLREAAAAGRITRAVDPPRESALNGRWPARDRPRGGTRGTGRLEYDGTDCAG